MVAEHLIREFIAEAEEQLFFLEPRLLRLEKDPQNTELMNDIFLATHSIKGTASYVGLSHISNFTHSLETLLDRLRKRELQTSPELIDVLLEGIDTLKLLITHVSLGKPAPDTAVTTEKLARWHTSVPTILRESVSGKEGCSPKIEQPATREPQFPQQSFWDFQEITLDPEDGEIFADIVSQQIECMHLSLQKLRALLPGEGSSDQEAMRSNLSIIIKAFRQTQSSAAILSIDAIDAVFTEHEPFFADLEDQEILLGEQELDHITTLLKMFETMTAAISDYSAEATLTGSEQNPSATPGVQEAAPQSFTLDTPLLDISHTLRVNAERVDYLLNLVGELVINRARLGQISHKIKVIYEDLRAEDSALITDSPIQRKKHVRMFKKLKEHFDEIILDLERLTNQMQEGTMRIRMVPISQVVSRFPRMVRDLSRQAGKEVNIYISGTDTELDKTVIDIIADPLIHLLRNAVDHGVESPDVRAKRGKPVQGTITLSAYHEGSQVIIEVADDGNGIDLQVVKQKSIQQGLIRSQNADTLTDHELVSLIFHSGFSTVETISHLSGRGVGLNVVKRYLEKINGSIELENSPGHGCKFIIKLPLTLAIIPALMVRVRSEMFAIPLISVEEAIRITLADIKTIESHKVIHLRERMVPLFDFADIFGTTVFETQPSPPDVWDHGHPLRSFDSPQDRDQDKFYGVILSDGFREIGLIVDSLFGESDIVIKSLNADLVNVEGISGASIQGDGQVALVIDTVSLINLAIEHLRRNHRKMN